MEWSAIAVAEQDRIVSEVAQDCVETLFLEEGAQVMAYDAFGRARIRVHEVPCTGMRCGSIVAEAVASRPTARPRRLIDSPLFIVD